MTTSVSDNGKRIGSGDHWEVQVFFDGDCPLCKREIAALMRLDRKRSISFVNIADPDFAAGEYGRTMSELMAQIHGRLPDGSWITGVEVFRRLYSAVGFSWLVAATRLPLVSPLLDACYRQFAKRRLNWTGRCRTASEACRST